MGMEDEQHHIWLTHAQFLRLCLTPHMTGENGFLDMCLFLVHEYSLYFYYEICRLHIYPVFFHHFLCSSEECIFMRLCVLPLRIDSDSFSASHEFSLVISSYSQIP